MPRNVGYKSYKRRASTRFVASEATRIMESIERFNEKYRYITKQIDDMEDLPIKEFVKQAKNYRKFHKQLYKLTS